MKIQNDITNGTPQVAGDKGISPVSPKGKVGEASGISAPERADLAETSLIARQLEADPARLEQLRQAIQRGTYNVPAADIAARLIGEHLNKLR